jgi:DNA-binding NarL/FixJ family response regulator
MAPPAACERCGTHKDHFNEENTMNHTLRRSTVFVMQHDPLLRVGLVAALREQAHLDVLVELDAAGSTAPAVDVVVADYEHGMGLAQLGTRPPSPQLACARILVVTGNDREADVRRAIEAGIHGYLLLGGALSELAEGVAAVAEGARFLGRSVAQRMADSLTHARLTSREIDVLRYVVEGASNKAIARQLQIELGTVKSHMSAIMTKLGASSRTQAAGIAASRGLVDEPRQGARMPVRPRIGVPASMGYLPRISPADLVEARA